MTVATELNLVTYLGDDSAVTFPFTFPVYSADHLKVYLRDLVTFATVLLSSADYTVNGIGNENGGSVVTDNPVAIGVRIIVARILPLTQDLDVLNQGGFYPANVEKEFDLLESQIQQVDEKVNRSVRGVILEQWPEISPPPLRRSKLLGFEDTDLALPTTDVLGILVAYLAEILQAGPGIELTVSATTITITNTAMGGESEEAWLLEDATSGGTGGGGADPETVRNIIGTALQGLGCVIVVDDAANTITVDLTQDVTAEIIRDTIGVALVAGTGITIGLDDAGNHINISVDTSNFGEIARDAVGAALTGGRGITVTLDDAGNTITLDNDPKIQAVASAATVTPTFLNDQVNITAQAAGLTLANWTGTAVDGHGIVVRLTDNGTNRAIFYGTKYRAFNDGLPASTTANKTLYLGFVYNLADDTFDLLGVREEA